MDKNDVKVLTNSDYGHTLGEPRIGFWEHLALEMFRNVGFWRTGLVSGGRVRNRYGSLSVMNLSMDEFDDSVIYVDADSHFKPDARVNISVVTHNCVFGKLRPLYERVFNIIHNIENDVQKNRIYGPNEYYLTGIKLVRPSIFRFPITDLLNVPKTFPLHNRSKYIK